jgi:hypothetical protein
VPGWFHKPCTSHFLPHKCEIPEPSYFQTLSGRSPRHLRVWPRCRRLNLGVELDSIWKFPLQISLLEVCLSQPVISIVIIGHLSVRAKIQTPASSSLARMTDTWPWTAARQVLTRTMCKPWHKQVFKAGRSCMYFSGSSFSWRGGHRGRKAERQNFWRWHSFVTEYNSHAHFFS